MKKINLIALCIVLASTGVAFGQRSSNVNMPVAKRFIIQSAMNYGVNPGGCWDIPGKPRDIKKGSNIQVWNLDEGVDRFFTLIQGTETGFYEIYVGDTGNSRVDIDEAKANNGTNVKVWDRNGSTAQRFAFVHLGNGRFKIYDRNGKVLCLANRASNNGSNIHIWDDHDGAWMEWYLLDANTRQAFNPTPVAPPTPRPTITPEPAPKPAPKPTPKPTPKPKPTGKKTVMPTKK